MDFYNPKGQAHQSPEMPAHQTWTVKLGIPLQILVSGQQHIITISGVDVLLWLELDREINEIHSTESVVWCDIIAKDMCDVAWYVTGANNSWDIV
jgi:hypothetical protein